MAVIDIQLNEIVSQLYTFFSVSALMQNSHDHPKPRLIKVKSAEISHRSVIELRNKSRKVISLTPELKNDEEKYARLESRIIKLESALDKIKQNLESKHQIRIASLRTSAESETTEKMIKIMDLQKRESEIAYHQVIDPVKKFGKQYPREYDVKLKIENLLKYKAKLSEYAVKMKKMENMTQNNNLCSSRTSKTSESTVRFNFLLKLLVLKFIILLQNKNCKFVRPSERFNK